MLAEGLRVRTCLTTNRGLVGFASALVGERGGLSSRALTFAVGAADGDVWGGLGAGVRLAVLARRVVPGFHVMRAHVLRLCSPIPVAGRWPEAVLSAACEKPRQFRRTTGSKNAVCAALDYAGFDNVAWSVSYTHLTLPTKRIV